MSHWTKVKTKLRDKGFIKKGLQRMGFEVEEGNFTISQYRGSEQAELRVDKAVGMSQQKDGTWSMVGDFYNSSKMRRYYNNTGKFEQDLNAAYCIEQSKEELENHQFYCAENEEGAVGEDGKIRMVYERWA